MKCELCKNEINFLKYIYQGVACTTISKNNSSYSISYLGNKKIVHMPYKEREVYFCNENEKIIWEIAKSINV